MRQQLARQQNSRTRRRQDGVRDLSEILRDAETSRVLNLSAIGEERRQIEEYTTLPFFENRLLNRSIIMKHALSTTDAFNYVKDKARATKIIFPLDRNNLSLGGLYGLIGQKSFTEMMSRHCGEPEKLSDRDARVLDLIDDLPTLDPFLLYALLRSNDILVSQVYFQLTEADRESIRQEMAAAFSPLVHLCFPDGRFEAERVKIFLDKILNFADGEEIDALRAAFQLEKEPFAMAMFAWRGLIYYKWKSEMLAAGLDGILAKFARIRVLESREPANMRMLEMARAKILNIAGTAAGKVRHTIALYDSVFDNFVQERQAEKFRQFLIGAPDLFTSCGQSVAIVEHIINFFNHRTDAVRESLFAASDFADMMSELETEMGFDFQARLKIW
jgi:hypothetical protein